MLEKLKLWWLKVSPVIHTWAFWMLIFFLAGHYSGKFMADKVLETRVKDSVKLGGIVIDDVPYNIVKR
jgi:hypothetical protein